MNSSHPAPEAAPDPWADPLALRRGVPPDDGRPLLLVWGNCQAESLRLLLAAGDVRTVRLPAVHELGATDVAALHRLVAASDLLVSQPVAEDYHDLPIGTTQLAALQAPQARQVSVPIVRFAGLYPEHVVVHPPHLLDPVPPLVAYHDLRVATAAAWSTVGCAVPAEAAAPLTAEAVLAVGERSLAELRRREAATDVVASDLLQRPTFASMRTINHPGNAVLEPLARRVRAALGLPVAVPDVVRPLLDSVHAPRDPVVAGVHDPAAAPSDVWWIEGGAVSSTEVAAAHTDFYRRRPDVLVAVLERSAPERSVLGLRTPEECR